MNVTRSFAVAATFAAVAVGAVAPASAAPEMRGHYVVTETAANDRSATDDWYFTPCGDGCESVARKGVKAFAQAHLVGGQWILDVTGEAAMCPDNPRFPMLSPRTSRGTQAPGRHSAASPTPRCARSGRLPGDRQDPIAAGLDGDGAGGPSSSAAAVMAALVVPAATPGPSSAAPSPRAMTAGRQGGRADDQVIGIGKGGDGGTGGAGGNPGPVTAVTTATAATAAVPADRQRRSRRPRR